MFACLFVCSVGWFVCVPLTWHLAPCLLFAPRAGFGAWGILDVTTNAYEVRGEVAFLWDGPWSKMIEWHRGTIEAIELVGTGEQVT